MFTSQCFNERKLSSICPTQKKIDYFYRLRDNIAFIFFEILIQLLIFQSVLKRKSSNFFYVTVRT